MTKDQPDRESTASAVPTYETGVFLAVNAIENSILVSNSPRCSFFRGMKVFMHNDIRSTIYSSSGLHRLITTEWMGYEDVCGDEETFALRLEQATLKFPDYWTFTFQNISSLVTGFDLSGLTALTSSKSDSVLIPIEGPRLDLDWISGYDEVVSGLLAHLLDRGGQPVELLLFGHLFCRNEADETENVREIRRLASCIGIEDTLILLSGGNVQPSRVRPVHVAAMPYAAGKSKKVVSEYGSVYADLPLPLGIEGTAAWLRKLGELTGKESDASRCIDLELSALVPDIQYVVTDHLLGRRAVVVGDAHIGGALVRFLTELGLEVEALFNISFTEAEGVNCREFNNPSPEQFAALLGEAQVDIVVGSGVFKYLSVETGIPYVELGFPSYLTHAIYPKPYLGFTGARCIVDALFNAVLNHDG